MVMVIKPKSLPLKENIWVLKVCSYSLTGASLMVVGVLVVLYAFAPTNLCKVNDFCEGPSFDIEGFGFLLYFLGFCEFYDIPKFLYNKLILDLGLTVVVIASVWYLGNALQSLSSLCTFSNENCPSSLAAYEAEASFIVGILLILVYYIQPKVRQYLRINLCFSKDHLCQKVSLDIGVQQLELDFRSPLLHSQ